MFLVSPVAVNVYIGSLSVSNVITSKAVKHRAVRTVWSGSIIMIKGSRWQLSSD